MTKSKNIKFATPLSRLGSELSKLSDYLAEGIDMSISIDVVGSIANVYVEIEGSTSISNKKWEQIVNF